MSDCHADVELRLNSWTYLKSTDRVTKSAALMSLKLCLVGSLQTIGGFLIQWVAHLVICCFIFASLFSKIVIIHFNRVSLSNCPWLKSSMMVQSCSWSGLKRYIMMFQCAYLYSLNCHKQKIASYKVFLCHSAAEKRVGQWGGAESADIFIHFISLTIWMITRSQCREHTNGLWVKLGAFKFHDLLDHKSAQIMCEVHNNLLPSQTVWE